MDMFCVLRNSDTRTGVPLYICNAPGPNSPHNQQPLFILMGKESAELIGEDITRVDREWHILFFVKENLPGRLHKGHTGSLMVKIGSPNPVLLAT